MCDTKTDSNTGAAVASDTAKVRLAPRDCKNSDDICRLNRDNITINDYWCLFGVKTITICKQKIGENPTEQVTIPRDFFDKIIDYYNGEVKP